MGLTEEDQSAERVSKQDKKRKDYAFWRQFNEKPSITPGCPGKVSKQDNVFCCLLGSWYQTWDTAAESVMVTAGTQAHSLWKTSQKFSNFVGKTSEGLVSLQKRTHTDSQEVQNRLEQCIRGDAEAPSLALYLMGPALLRVGRTQDQLVAPTVAGKLCPDHQDLKAVMLPSFAHPHSTSTDSLCECELKLIMQQLANSFQAVILTFKCRGMP